MAAGSGCRPQTPPVPGPSAIQAKPWLGSRSLDAGQIPWTPRHSSGLQVRSGTWTAAAGREDPPARSPAFTFPRAAWESAARRPLAVPSAPGSVAESSQREQGSLNPASGRHATPPGAMPRPSTLADYRAEPRWPSGVFARVAAMSRLQLLLVLPPLSWPRLLKHPINQDAPNC